MGGKTPTQKKGVLGESNFCRVNVKNAGEGGGDIIISFCYEIKLEPFGTY